MVYCIVCVSDGDKHFAYACDEYNKRLGKHLIIRHIKTHIHTNPTHTIQKDTQTVISIVQKNFLGWHKILLSTQGMSLDTLGLYHYCQQYNKIVFIIGGPYGLDEQLIRPYIDTTLALSLLTLPHGLAKLVLVEQLYRIHTIQIGKKYHY